MYSIFQRYIDHIILLGNKSSHQEEPCKKDVLKNYKSTCVGASFSIKLQAVLCNTSSGCFSINIYLCLFNLLSFFLYYSSPLHYLFWILVNLQLLLSSRHDHLFCSFHMGKITCNIHIVNYISFSAASAFRFAVFFSISFKS